MPEKDLRDVGLADTELQSKSCGSLTRSTAYLKNLFLCELGFVGNSRSSFVSDGISSSSVMGVLDVPGRVTEIEMPDVHAQVVVAGVQDVRVSWVAVGDDPNESRSIHLFSLNMGDGSGLASAFQAVVSWVDGCRVKELNPCSVWALRHRRSLTTTYF